MKKNTEEKTKNKNQNMDVYYIPINDLKPAEYNPRSWNKDQENQLRESIKKFGMVDPIIINIAPNRENIIVGGHFRWQVAKKMGVKEVPAVCVNIPDIQKEKELT
jgi:ParB/RepB/Spo0J family partition protein